MTGLKIALTSDLSVEPTNSYSSKLLLGSKTDQELVTLGKLNGKLKTASLAGICKAFFLLEQMDPTSTLVQGRVMVN